MLQVENGQPDKIRENRLRRMAKRQGLRLVKSRRRDPRAIGYGGFMIVDGNNLVVAGEIDSARALDLDAVETYLAGTDGVDDTSTDLITTKTQLLAWVQQHASDHAQAGPHRCACGWRGDTVPDNRLIPWIEHVDTSLISGLGDVLPSDESLAGHSPYPWRALVHDLHDRIDGRS